MDNRDKRRIDSGLARHILMALALLLIAWSFWPPPTDRETLAVSPALVESSGWQDCAALNQLLDYEFELVTPRALWQAQSSTVLLTLRRVSDAGRDAAILSPSAQDCSLALETRLAAANLHSAPGTLIIQPFVGADTQSFVFTISPQSKETVSGKLWIYASLAPADGGAGQDLPLFSVPLDLPVWTILGQPPVLVRYISLMVLLILLAFEIRQRLLAE